MRKILLPLLLVLIAVIAIVVVVGSLLPQSHVASRDALVNAPPPAVFESIRRVADHPAWRSGVEGIDVLGTDPLRWRERAGGDVITFEAIASEPPHRFVSKIADPELPFGGTWTFELRPEGAGTRVTITEHGEVYNPVFRFLSALVFGHTSGMEAYLAALQRRHASVQ